MHAASGGMFRERERECVCEIIPEMFMWASQIIVEAPQSGSSIKALSPM